MIFAVCFINLGSTKCNEVEAKIVYFMQFTDPLFLNNSESIILKLIKIYKCKTTQENKKKTYLFYLYVSKLIR